MVLKLTRTDIAFVKGQKKMMDFFKKKIEKEVDKITLANTAIADWNEKIESIDKFTVGLYGKTVTEIMGIIDVEEQTPLIVQDKATGEYVPNPEAVGTEEEKEEETPEVEEEQIPDSTPDEPENIESELKMEEKEEEKEADTSEEDSVPFEEELGWPDEDSDESLVEEEEEEKEAKDPMEDSEWPDPDYPDDWNN